MTKLAVYGTLKRGHGNNRLLQGAEFIGKGKTKDKFLMTSRGFPQVYEKSFTPESMTDKTTNVTVEIFDVPDNMIGNIDRLEGHPNWYQRKPTNVVLDNGDEVVAELYFMQETPNLKYTNILEEGVY